MGVDKQGSKGGNYVGGFLQMFDWNGKSRKKLFSSKSDVPEQSKQKKTCNGNFPKTRLNMLDADENAAGSSVKVSSDHSCSSSVIDEDFCGTKAPGVVARLMGLDSLPKASLPEHYSSPLSDSHSLHDSYYQRKRPEHNGDQIMQLSNLQDVLTRINMEPKYQKVIHRPIEKFQTEVLPPKFAKSIPITHHKLLSPIKSANAIPPKDAAQIMEAAARIIDPRPQERKKAKQPLIGAPSVPLRVRDLKEKVGAAQKPLKIYEESQRKAESSVVKCIRGQSMNKSWNGSTDAIPDSEESSGDFRHKGGKSISLALQAKANVLKREGISVSSRNLAIQKEPCELRSNHLFKSQSTAQKGLIKKPSLQNGTGLLRQNNQKQNCIVDRGNLCSSSNSKGGKTFSGESSSRQRNSSKLAATSKVSSRKLSSEVTDDKRGVSSSSTERITSKKRSADGSYHSGKNQIAHNMKMDANVKAIQSKDNISRQSGCDQDSGRTGTDVISFTFTSPMKLSGPGSGGSTETEETCKIFSAGYRSRRSTLISDDTSASRLSQLGPNVMGGDALSILLEEKLRELTQKVDFSQQKPGSHLYLAPDLEVTMRSTMVEGSKPRDGTHTDDQGVVEEMCTSDGNMSQPSKLLDCRLPSPVSVLEHSPFAESCTSSDTAESTSTTGRKQFSTIQAQEVLESYSLSTLLGIDGDAELSDSASSTSAKKTYIFSGSRTPKKCELDYVKEMLCNIELMFKDYALGIDHEIIKPHLFDQLESHLSDGGTVPLANERLLFDCVGECLELKCKQYVSGGYRLWAKGVSMVRSKDRLAEEVYKETSGWNVSIGESMIDEFVDKDMSNRFGRWLEFDIEAFELGIQIESRILSSLIDEVVADILAL